MDLRLDMWSLSTIFDGKWLCASVVEDVLAEVAVLPLGVQLMAFESAYWIVEKLKANRRIEYRMLFIFSLIPTQLCLLSIS